MYACIMRLITNYVSISKYQQRFFPNEPLICPYSKVSLETQKYIMYNCDHYQKSLQDSLKDIITFLKFSLDIFYCQDDNVLYFTCYQYYYSIVQVFHLNYHLKRIKKTQVFCWLYILFHCHVHLYWL